MLVLFDIDMTLIRTDGAGMRAIEDAGRHAFGDGFTSEGVSFGGALDPLIIAQMLRGAGVEPTRDRIAEVRELYATRLGPVLSSRNSRALPGAIDLVDALEASEGVTLGLLTGNFQETGRLKLKACGIDADRFAVRVWGDDSPHDPPTRAHLPPVAIRRYETITGARIEPDRVTVIGDTVHDVSCARTNGCRSLGVTTGFCSGPQLAAAGADRVVSDLTETSALVAWLLEVV